MNKILAVARAEYFIAATSKAFILGIFMMPVFMGGALVVQYLTKDQIDTRPRKVAIVDHTGRMFQSLETQVKHHNEHETFSQEPGAEPRQTAAKFVLENAEPNPDDKNELNVELSKRVKAGDLFAFAVIEDGVYDASKKAVVRYHSQTPTYQTLPNWLRRAVNGEVKRHRTQEMGLSPSALQALAQQTPLKSFGLVSVNENGKVDNAKEENRVLSFAIPFAGLMMMFMMIMSVAPAMLNNVLEEKMQKISEFLVSSVTPFQLMMGKLTGAVGIGLTLSMIYLGAAFGLAHYFEIADRIPISLYAWFVYFLFIALVIFGSIFSAIGAACSEIRDAQSLMTPVMLLVIIPMMCIGPVFDSPSSTFSKAVSLFPPATPMLMFARIAMQPGPEPWEIVLAAILSAAFATACVWAAGKVFRVGILSQGQAPSFARLVGWVLTK
jgi:ABC-2 type transport system permease protein